MDGGHWFTIADKSRNDKDQPNAYIELSKPAESRYVRYRNIHVPTPCLAVSGLRVFGLGHGDKPAAPATLQAVRRTDRRDAELTWKPVDNADGYMVYWGIAPDKLYSSYQVKGSENALTLRCLNTDQEYWFAVEAFNANGISPRTSAAQTVISK